MLHLGRLRLLQEVAARGSFTAAARSLHLTQPAVSRQIARLEADSGLRLLDREPEVRLTDAGRSLLAHAESIFGHVAAAEQELDAHRGLRAGRLRVGSFPTAGATLALDALSTFRRAHPAVEVTFSDADTQTGIRLLRSGELDVVLVFHRPDAALSGGEVEAIHLLDDTMFVALPKGHALVRRRRVALSALASEAWVVGTAATFTVEACRAAGFEPRVVARTDHPRIQHGLVAVGLGVTLVNGLGLSAGIGRHVAVRPVEPQLRRLVAAAVLAARPRPPALTAFLEVLERAVGSRDSR